MEIYNTVMITAATAALIWIAIGVWIRNDK